jgi:hypothetical protein
MKLLRAIYYRLLRFEWRMVLVLLAYYTVELPILPLTHVERYVIQRVCSGVFVASIISWIEHVAPYVPRRSRCSEDSSKNKKEKS